MLNRNNEISWSVGAGFAQDSTAVSGTKGRLSGGADAIHRFGDKLTMQFGGAYTYVFGKGRLVPVFGVVWRPDSNTTIHVLGPFSGGVQHRIGSRLIVGAQAGMRGNQYRMASSQQFPSASGEVRLGVRELHTGGVVRVIVSRSVSLSAQAGVASARQLTIADGKTSLFSSAVGTKPYATIGLRYSFSKQPRWDGFDRW